MKAGNKKCLEFSTLTFRVVNIPSTTCDIITKGIVHTLRERDSFDHYYTIRKPVN